MEGNVHVNPVLEDVRVRPCVPEQLRNRTSLHSPVRLFAGQTRSAREYRLTPQGQGR